ncbi:hypothetical protein HAPAU_40960 [Halalkalicoccus paucihalophilus]|uniref:GmrSD restriction endonucleases N-terminal domain-containing protein n=1 Tax=Halalkalicoccus paucihalophilus TaxID=1008153 RepID=A0A151A9G4_9EURY|nr:DUF262 domain-containing protein [Halalkalicoccus paucihalophilus]KYH24017.1 hypothetical protein HAPAU_40960 [Halalkalicoccus paucihalophilus]
MSESIEQLLNKIENRELVLPEFQREFTWSHEQAKLLVDSLMEGYPTGSLLLWKTNEPPALKNMPDYEPDGRVEVLLDGQQRLTVLYLLVKDKIPPYYADLPKDPRNLYYNLATGNLKYYKKSEMSGDPRWVRVADCFSSENEPNVSSIVDNLFDEDKFEKYTKFDENLNQLEDIIEEEVPVMYVKDDASLKAALTVFDRVNSQGTPLTESDIALAHMVSSWPETRRVFKEKLQDLEQEGFEFDLPFLARGMNAVINCRAEYSQLHEVSEESLRNGWDELTEILDYLINILRHHAYIYTTDDLNTPNVLIPMIAHLSRHNKEFRSENERNMMLYWMYGALLLRRYSRSVDANLAQDLNALSETEPLKALVATLKEEEGEPTVTASNLDLRAVNHPLYNMMCIVIRSRGGVDWRNGLDLSEPYGNSYKIERHHIFPRSRLSEAGYDTGDNHYDKKRVNEIANRVPLTKSGNIGIFNDHPIDYLPQVERNYPDALDTHMVPTDRDLWEIDQYEEFLAARRDLIAAGINDYLESLIGGIKPIEAETIVETPADS